MDASGSGFLLFPAHGFRLRRDGDTISWALGDSSDWCELAGGAQYRGFAAAFDAAAPAELAGYSPPWLVLTETRMVQVWTGAVARTAPGWSLWLKAPANLPGQRGLEVLEGIIPTDTWRGPLFNNLRLVGRGPFNFPAHQPLFQAVPIERGRSPDLVISGMAGLGPDDWAAFGKVVKRDAPPR